MPQGLYSVNFHNTKSHRILSVIISQKQLTYSFVINDVINRNAKRSIHHGLEQVHQRLFLGGFRLELIMHLIKQNANQSYNFMVTLGCVSCCSAIYAPAAVCVRNVFNHAADQNTSANTWEAGLSIFFFTLVDLHEICGLLDFTLWWHQDWPPLAFVGKTKQAM